MLLLGCAVAAASAGGYYYYSTRTSSTSGSDGKPGSSSSSSKKKNKKKKKGLQSGFLKGEGADGPLVEEIKPAFTAAAGAEKEAGEKQTQEPGTSHLNDVPDAAGLTTMSETVSPPWPCQRAI